MVRTQTTAITQDSRASRRQRALLGGKLIFGVAGLNVDCVIRDFSEAGARVRLPTYLATEDSVWLINVSVGVAYRAEVRWRKGLELGLSFTERYDLKSPTSGALTNIRLLWLECSGRRLAPP